MQFQFTPYLWPSLLAVTVALAVAAYAWMHRRAPGASAFAALMIAVVVWSVCYSLELSGSDIATKSFWGGFKYLGIVVVPLAWFIFALQYTRREREVTRRNVILLSIIPALSAILAVTNSQHHLFWDHLQLVPIDGYVMWNISAQPLFWVHAIYSYALLAGGTVLLAVTLLQLPQVYRGQTVVLLLAMAVPLTVNLLTILGLSPVPYVDLTSFAFVLGGLVLAIGLLRYHLFDLAPMARDTVIESMRDGMIVLDVQGRIVDCNPAAQRLLSASSASLIGRPIDEVLSSRSEVSNRYQDGSEAQGEIQLNGRTCELRISPLTDGVRHLSGRLIVLRDITTSRRAEGALRRSQAQLSAIINTAQDAIITLNSDLHIVMFNAGAERMFECSAAEVMGQPIDRFIPERFRAVHADYIRTFGQTGATTRTMGVGNVAAVRANGKEFPTEASISRVNVDGQDFFTVILRDITVRKQDEAALRTQKQLFENLVGVARATTAKPDLEDTLRNVLRVGVSLTAAARGSLFLFDADGLVTHAVSVRDNAPPDERRTVIGRVTSQGLVGWVARQKQTALIVDTRDDARWLSLSEEGIPTRSALAVPIMSGQTLLGALTLRHTEPGHFTEEHVHLMQAAADQMAFAVRNARSFEAQRRMADRQKMLYEILRTVGSQLDRDAVARTAAESISLFTDWQSVAVILPDEERQHWVVRAVSGALPMTVGLSFPLEEGIIGRAFVTGKVQNVADASADPDFLFPQSTMRSKLVVPLRRGDRVLGVLNIDSEHVAAFDADDLSLARSLADAVALALDNARLYQAIADERSRLQALITASRDGMVLLGMNERILVINEPALRLLGLPNQPDDWLDRSVLEVIPLVRRRVPQVARAIMREIRRTQTGYEPSAEGDYDVAPYSIHWLSLPVLSEAAPLGRLIVMRDVTEERSVAAMRDELTNTMVHDLRNPLTVIQSSLELLTIDSPDEVSESQQQVLEVMQHGTQRMLNLVTAILDVNRLESGQMPLDREPVLLPMLVADVLAMQTVLADEKQLQLINEVAADLPPVSVDVELVRRVFQNVIGNAIKFTPPDGTVRVSAQIDPSDERMLAVSVCDTGPGVPLDLQPRLFERFVTGRSHGRGSGLGLAFCRLVLEAHGGRIWVESGAGPGAMFKFTLPIVE